MKGPNLLSGAPSTLRRREVGNGGITVKTRHMFSVHTSPEEFENATITGNFGFVFEENSFREIT